MPTTKQLADLFRAIGAHNLSAAAGVAELICRSEERKGHRQAARQLRGALSNNGVSKKDSLAHDTGNGHAPPAFLSTALVRLDTGVTLADVVLSPASRKELNSLILEWEHRQRLSDKGITPRSKLLFHGPPGCGKSLTARALGHELGIPVYLVRFDAVIGAYLGQTAIHLRQLFHFAESTAAILLMDELDALGKQRGNPLDVGELDRIVIAMMQELEHSSPRGLIIGTSNLPRHLDSALWRRFDLALEFKAPSQAALIAFGRYSAKQKGFKLESLLSKRLGKLKSFADAEALVTREARRRLIEDA